MADKKISALTSLAQGDVAASTDVLPIVDTSATETKKVTAAALVGAGLTAGVTNVDINSGSIDGTTIGANSAAAGTFTTLTGTTKVVSPYVDAVGSAGGQLRNASGTSQLAWGAGGGSNLSLEVATNINPANAAVSIAPTGTGTVTINPATAGTMNNVAIGGSTAAAGSFTTLTTSSTVTLNGGTANGVLYLNGSKVATSGTALVFDGTNLGLAVTPSAWGSIFRAVQVGTGGSIFGRSSGNQDVFQMGANVFWDGSNWKYIGNGASTRYEQATGTHVWSYAASGTAGNTITFTEAMVLNASGNLGIGTSSPAYKLDVAESGAPTSTNTFSVARISGSDSVANDLTLLGPNTSQVRIKFGDPEDATIGEVGYNHSTNALRFVTNGSEVGLFDSSGNLGLGVSPSAWGSTFRALQMTGAASIAGTTDPSLQVSQNAYYNGTNWIYSTTGAASNYNQAGGVHAWRIAPSWNGTGSDTISWTQAMTLDASGNLLVGGTSNALGARAIFENAAGNQIGVRYTGIATYYLNADSGGSLVFSKDGTERARISSDGTFRVKGAGTAGSTDAFLVDGAAPASAARITSGGDLLVGTTSPATNRRLVVSGGGISAEAPTSVASGTFSFADNGASPNTARFYNGTDSNDATQRFIICDAGASVPRAEIRSNGGLANYSGNNVNLSDERVKTDIKPLGSMWDKFKAIEIVAFKYKDQTHDDNNIGVVAQQVESVAPEFVDVDGFGETPEDGVPLKTIYTEDFHNAAIKALQEAMARIEQLEAKVAALESK